MWSSTRNVSYENRDSGGFDRRRSATIGDGVLQSLPIATTIGDGVLQSVIDFASVERRSHGYRVTRRPPDTRRTAAMGTCPGRRVAASLPRTCARQSPGATAGARGRRHGSTVSPGRHVLQWGGPNVVLCCVVLCCVVLCCVVLCCVVLCCVVLCCVVLRRVASRRVASRRVASRRVASRRVASRRVASRRVASRRVASRRVASRRVASRCVVATMTDDMTKSTSK